MSGEIQITGQTLYDEYQRLLWKHGVEVDDWEDLPTLERHAWDEAVENVFDDESDEDDDEG